MQLLHPTPNNPDDGEFTVGPALFGPDLGAEISAVSGELYVLPGEEGGTALMGNGCEVFSEQDAEQSREKVVMMTRGGCLFIQKVSHSE